MKKDIVQFSIFWINKLCSFEFAWKEYKLYDLADQIKNDWSRINVYCHDSKCKWYDVTDQEKTFYFLNEKERDDRLELLNNHYWTDIYWNNIFWYFKIWIYIQDNAEIVQSFWDIFIYWIWLIKNSQEKMLRLEKDKHVFLQKQLKKTWQKTKTK